METIVLNKKKKKVMWKRIFLFILIIAAIAGCLWFNGHFRATYKYYSIDENRNKIVLGNSDDKLLIEHTLIEVLDKAKTDGYQIADYNMHYIVEKEWHITWKKNPDNTDGIKSAIADYIYVIVYALELDIDGKTYIFPEKQGYQVLTELNRINKDLNITMLDGVFVNKNEIMDQSAIDEFISNYKLQYENK